MLLIIYVEGIQAQKGCDVVLKAEGDDSVTEEKYDESIWVTLNLTPVTG